MNDTTLNPAQCAKCLKAITYEPRVYIVDGMYGYILCVECFNKMFGVIPETKNMNIEVNAVLQIQPKTERYVRAKVESVEKAEPHVVEPEEAKE